MYGNEIYDLTCIISAETVEFFFAQGKLAVSFENVFRYVCWKLKKNMPACCTNAFVNDQY